MRQDLTGQEYGRLTVIAPAEDAVDKNGNHFSRWACQCSCGNTKIVRAAELKRGATRSCGCLRKEIASERNAGDLLGKTFYSLTVIQRLPSQNNQVMWLAKCICGGYIVASTTDFTHGYHKTCGCLKFHRSERYSIDQQGLDDTSTLTLKRNSRLYHIWKQMRQRCDNPNALEYHRYGARGITYCEEWDNFRAFESWAMDNGYSDSLSIDRIDNDGNYCPENCRWATSKQQARNCSRNRIITANGQTMTLADWSDYSGISYNTICNRLYNLHWQEEEAVTCLPNQRGKRHGSRGHIAVS